MKLKPTKEQKEILAAVKKNKGDIRINAYAGTGKSTTLCLIAENNPDKDFLYLAFNKAIAKAAESKFPSNCEVRTVHGLAFKHVLPTIQHKNNFFNKLQGFWKLRDYIKHFQMNAFKSVLPASVDHYDFCADIRRIVTRFKLSDEPAITASSLNRDQKKLAQPIQDLILSTARSIWESEIDMKCKVPLDHNTYLKMWELSEPELNEYDFILFDEAQDANPAMNSVVSKLPMSRIYVGDQYQAIYGWNGAVNAMQTIEPDHDLFLSKSWRFGPVIAQEANRLLGFLGDLPKKIDGNEDIPSVIGDLDLDKPYTVIFRTNGALAMEAIDLLKEEKKVYVEGGVKELCNDLRALYHLKLGSIFREAATRYKPFKTFGEVCEESKIDVTIRRDLMFIATFDDKTLETLDFLESNVLTKRSRKKAEVSLTTAHKSKGLEWDQVHLFDDFRFEVPITLKFISRPEREEFNLLYVAITRAIRVLQTNGAYCHFIETLSALQDSEEKIA